MKLSGKVVVVTGGAQGIGRALARRFAAEGARVVVGDLDGPGAEQVGREISGLGMRCDVRHEEELIALAARAKALEGRIDLFCSNAGIAPPGGVELPDAQWQQLWEVNVMSHVWAARAVLPDMLARGEGYLLSTASAAGLLASIGAAAYSVTKHSAVALAEWLSITYGGRGIKVSCLCPQGVRTNMVFSGADDPASKAVLASGAMLEPEIVAEATVRGLLAERFLILPHPEVQLYFERRAQDHERWLGSMRKLHRKVTSA